MPPQRRARGRKSADVRKTEVQGNPTPKYQGPPAQESTFKQQLRHTGYRIVAIVLVTLVMNYFRKQDVPHEIPWKVVDLPGRGKGMIATRLVKQGERIMTEEPLFIVPSTITGDPKKLLKSKIDGISPEGKAAFYGLSYADPNITEEEIPLSIFQTNGISAGASGVGIFPKTARLNHACSAGFNAVYSWREEGKHLVVHTLKDVQPGDEFLTTYFDTKRPRNERRDYLQKMYNFHCSCPVCSLPADASRASDMRLQSMAAAHAKFSTWSKGDINGLEALDLVREMWRLGEEEGYWSERGQLAADAAHVAASHSDEHAARNWAALAHLWYGYEIGEDSIQAKAIRVVAETPHNHIAWGSKERMDVGDLTYGMLEFDVRGES